MAGRKPAMTLYRSQHDTQHLEKPMPWHTVLTPILGQVSPVGQVGLPPGPPTCTSA